jgi:hypothetical protein
MSNPLREELGNALAPVTTCLHCSERFDGGVEIIGRPSARMEALLMKLGSHMNTKHPEHAQALGLHGAAFMGLLFLKNFKSTDAELNLHRDQMRWQIHQQTLNARFSDESLREQCSALAARLVCLMVDADAIHETRAKRLNRLQNQYDGVLLEVFTGIRNDLEEPGKYAVNAVAQ